MIKVGVIGTGVMGAGHARFINKHVPNAEVIGISDTNADPILADYPIPANDDAISSVKFILEKVKKASINNFALVLYRGQKHINSLNKGEQI